MIGLPSCGSSNARPVRRRALCFALRSALLGPLLGALLGALLGTIAGYAQSQTQQEQSWPSKSVRIVVPSSSGGGTDAYARLMAQSLSEAFGQSFLVDNRPGASGNIGTEIVARAAPDGHTLLITASAAIAINPNLFPRLGFDVARDLAPVAQGVRSNLVLVVNASVAAQTLNELIEAARREPARIAFGSAGTGTTTYLGVRVIEEHAKVQFLHVPYKGVGQAYQDLLAGNLKFVMADVATAYPHIRSGRARALVITTRSARLPGVPSMTELGFPFSTASAFSLMAPAGTPSGIIERLSQALRRAMRQPAVAEKLEGLVLTPIFDTPAEFAIELQREREFWGAFIRRNRISLE